MFVIFFYEDWKSNSSLHNQLIEHLIRLDKQSHLNCSMRYHIICLTPFQSIQVGVELYIPSKLIENAISGSVMFARDVKAPIALKYSTL